MKTKGIPFWEQHLEHFVLVLAVLIFAVLTAKQFIGDPNAGEINGKKVAPDELDPLLDAHAGRIREQISPTAPSRIEIPDPEPVLGKFDQARTAVVSANPTLPRLAPALSPSTEFIPDAKGGLFVNAEVPAPVALVAEQYFDTLPPEVVQEQEALQKLLPAEPHDIVWTTVAGRFPVAALLKQFSEDQPPNAVRLPVKWYNNTVYIIDVKSQRSELLEGDKWSDPITLDPLPGRESFRQLLAELAEKVDIDTREQVLGFVSDPAGRSEIIQPEFYTTMAGQWTPPGAETPVPAAAADPDGDEVSSLQRDLEQERKDRERLIKTLTDSGCPEQAPPPPPKDGDDKGRPGGPGGRGGGDKGGGGTAPPPGGGGLGGGLGGGGATGKRGPGGPPAKADESKCRRIRNQIKQKDDRIAKIEAQIKKLKPDAPALKPPDEKAPEEQPLPDEVLLWAHDITIQPGKTYRYRFVVEVYNPLFAHKLDLMPAQQKMAEQFTLASEPSEWSAPVTIQPPLRVFITDARPDAQGANLGGLTGGNATAEVYRFRAGRWWMESFRVSPGDRIGSPKAPKPASKDDQPPLAIDYTTDWFILDVVEDIGADKADTDRGFGATVVLQSLSAESLTQHRLPRDDSADSERKRLAAEVRLAEADIPPAKEQPG